MKRFNKYGYYGTRLCVTWKDAWLNSWGVELLWNGGLVWRSWNWR